MFELTVVSNAHGDLKNILVTINNQNIHYLNVAVGLFWPPHTHTYTHSLHFTAILGAQSHLHQ